MKLHPSTKRFRNRWRAVVKRFGALGQPRNYRLPILADIEIKTIAVEKGANQNQVVVLLVMEALEARKNPKLPTEGMK